MKDDLFLIIRSFPRTGRLHRNQLLLPLLVSVCLIQTTGTLRAQSMEVAENNHMDDAAAEGNVLLPESAVESLKDPELDKTEGNVSAGENVDETDPAQGSKEEIHEALVEERESHTVWYNPDIHSSFEILGKIVAPGERRQLKWSAGQSFSGRSVDVPVLVTRGTEPGPVLCLTAAIHGDELNGVEIIRRVLRNTEPEELSGTLIGVPIVNILGFTRSSRYLPDRRDLNRYFPGNPDGSSASRIAYLFFEQIVKHCDRLVDFHTGSFKRTNLPQLRADLDNSHVLEFTSHFGATAVLHKPRGRGTLRMAATNAGIPAITFELGAPASLQLEHVEFGVKAIETLIYKMQMIKRFRLWSEPQPVYYRSKWVRADRGGIMISNTKLGKHIKQGDLLGIITNPLTSEQSEITSPLDGRVLGLALNQFVLPGFAAFHIGIVADKPQTTINTLSPPSGAPGQADDDDISEEYSEEFPENGPDDAARIEETGSVDEEESH